MFQLNRIARSGLLFIAALSLAVITNCGGSNKQAQAPESMIRDFVAKHHVMVDESLATFYVTEEQAEMNKAIVRSTEEKKQDGTLASLQQASFDPSALQISIVDQKEEYVHDEPVDFMKISATGKLLIKMADGSKNIDINDVIILEKEGGNWKVTEKINPWS
jgi:hypothetical protein